MTVSTNKNTFPFDCIVVTCPDAKSAASALVYPLKRELQDVLQHQFPDQHITILSTFDPYGARCGSGGGTLAALEEADLITNANANSTICILHAGGDSSRCPTQMILGKAWLSLPSFTYPNPTIWLLFQLAELCHCANIPKGSVVVCATDCLATFFDNNNDSSSHYYNMLDLEYDSSSVLGVAVPSVVTTATNHGVYILNEKVGSVGGPQQEDDIQLHPPLDVWQKPSVEQLLLQNPSVAPASFTIEGRGNNTTMDKEDPQSYFYSWIDTGVVIFLPKAAKTLRELSLPGGLLEKCTRLGLERLYHQQFQSPPQSQATPTTPTLQEFALQTALKIDLYTDILHKLHWPNKNNTNNNNSNNNTNNNNNNNNKLQSGLQSVLGKLPLVVLVAPKGQFLHLGTTQELVQFLVHPGDSLQTSLNTSARHNNWNATESDGSVLLHSLFADDTTFTNILKVGTNSVVEHCRLDAYQEIQIGSDTLVSGWRNTTTTSTTTPQQRLVIPSNLSVQMVALDNHNNDNGDTGNHKHHHLHAYMVLGMQDDIKTPCNDPKTTVYGFSVHEFLARTGLTLLDLGWSSSTDSLWTAQLHPMVQEGTVSFQDIFGWLTILLKQQQEDKDATTTNETTITCNNHHMHKSLQLWKSLPRTSLKKLHGHANAQLEWDFRQDLECDITQRNELAVLEQLLPQRLHDQPCNLTPAVYAYDSNKYLPKALDLLESRVARVCLLAATASSSNTTNTTNTQLDIAGRAFLVASDLLADIVALNERTDGGADQEQDDGLWNACLPHVETIRSSSASVQDRVDALDEIIRRRRQYDDDDDGNSLNLAIYGKIMERLAFGMNQHCVAGGWRDCHDLDKLTDPNRVALLDKWVLATAPCRIDLAGAWSDTPPVCYEFGGSVTGVAVLVDNHKPLSCRCRIVSGKSGILLRTELRESHTGDLLSQIQTELDCIQDLANFCDPLSDCALLKCALVSLGMVSEDDISNNADLQLRLNQFCALTTTATTTTYTSVRLEIVATSLLPQGSGLGTSSILGGCILAAIAKCIGLGDLGDQHLFHAVLMLEQLLTSGGGYQDQVHGIVAGCKTVRSEPSQLPLKMSVEQVAISEETRTKLQQRLILGFTGKTRLAKNILQNVLRRWARRTPEIVETVQKLIENSEIANKALREGDLELLGDCMNVHWQLKKIMAGADSGAEPETVRELIQELMKLNAISGASLCGAGGGGFLALLAADGYDYSKIESLVKQELPDASGDFALFTWHECRVCDQGLTTQILEDPEDALCAETFQLSWQLLERMEDDANVKDPTSQTKLRADDDEQEQFQERVLVR
jgi:galactokinase/mevalonate kinase-like predicted kinase